MKHIYIPILLMLFSCQTPTNISEQEVRETFNELFDIIDNNIENFGSIITDDFYIFENSRKYTADEFIEFVGGFDIIETRRRVEDVVIDTDHNSAHLTLTQFGEFFVNTPEGEVKMDYEWLESVYFVKDNDKLKIKFYFSEVINNSTTPLQ